MGITEARLASYVGALGTFGLPYDQQRIGISDYYAPDGYQAMCTLLARGVPCTALLAMKDSVALGAMRALAGESLCPGICR